MQIKVIKELVERIFIDIINCKVYGSNYWLRIFFLGILNEKDG